ITVAEIAGSMVISTGTTCALAAVGVASIALGRIEMIGTPVVTLYRTVYSPPKTDWVATTTPSTESTSTASASSPEFNRTASRPAISRPSIVAGSSTAAGFAAAAAAAKPATCGVIRKVAASSDSAAYTLVAPNAPNSAASDSAVPGLPTTTADGAPSRAAAVSSSAVTLRTAPSW